MARRANARRYRLKSVRQSQPNVVLVSRAHLNLIRQLPLTARQLGAEQVALAGMPTHDFAGRRKLEALGCATMRLQLHLLILFHDCLIPLFRRAHIVARSCIKENVDSPAFSQCEPINVLEVVCVLSIYCLDL